MNDEIKNVTFCSPPWINGSRPGCLNFGLLTFGARRFSVVGDCVVQHPWHAPTRFQGHLFPHLGWPKTSQDIVRCSRGGQNAPWLRNSAVGRNNPWLWWHHRETTRLHASPGRSTRHHLGNSYQSRTKTNWSELSLYSIGLTKKFILVFSRRCYGNPIISIDISLSLSHTHTHTH